MTWSNVGGSDASWPTLDVSPVLAFAASAPSRDSAWQSCLSRIDDPAGGVDFVPVAQTYAPCWAKASGAVVTHQLSTLTSSNASMERVP